MIDNSTPMSVQAINALPRIEQLNNIELFIEKWKPRDLKQVSCFESELNDLLKERE